MFFPGKGRFDNLVPWATFTDPELAHAGLTIAEATERHGDDVEVWRMELAHSDRARADGTEDGLIVVVCVKRKIVGAHILAAAAGELIGELALAIERGMRFSDLASTIHVYPTLVDLDRPARGRGRIRGRAAVQMARPHMSRDWVTFDCYGTLADWLGGMRNALTPHVGAENAERLLHAYHDLEADVEAQRPAPRYREVLTETLRRAAEREGIELPAGSETALVDHWHELPIFDDVGAALGQLRENGWSLAILSNCDDDLLATTLERMPVPFDLTVTAEQVGSYKPDPGHWRGFEKRTDGRPRPLGARGPVVVPRHPDRGRARPAARLGRPPRLGRGRVARDGADPRAQRAARGGGAGRGGGLNCSRRNRRRSS